MKMFKKLSKKKKKMPIYIIVLIILAAVFLLWIAFGFFGSRVEQLQYTVIDSSKEYEIWEIHEHLVVETEVQGSFVEAGNEAFSILAGYIFGDNKSQSKIAMTAPVVETESEKIAMTAPVVAGQTEENLMTYAFVLPAKYTLETLPVPNDPRAKIREVERMKVAVLSFRGFFTDKNFDSKKEALKQYLERDGLSYSRLYSAGYNPPWTPPFMRRNEVWAELK